MNRVMSYLFYSLQQFGFSSLEEVTASSLKRAFKRNCVTYHPDHGGSSDHFDEMLSSYLYLSETLHRMNGGRSVLQCMNGPDELKQQRAEQERQNRYINELFDDLVIDSEDNSPPLPPDFHERFAAEHVNQDAHGYADWFSKHSDENVHTGDVYGDATITPFVEETRFHESFEELVRVGKPAPSQSIMLHPDEMAYSTQSGGYSLIKSSTFTSDGESNPTYVDLHDAYTSENTIYDKVAPPTAEALISRTYDDLLKEREEVYICASDADVEAIAAYEKKRIDEQTDHKKKLDSYFKMGVFLKDSEKNEVVTPVEFDEKDDFVNSNAF